MNKNINRMLNIFKLTTFSLCISLVFTQNLESFMQKTTLENSLRDKIYSEVGAIVDKTKFVVVVNLILDDNMFLETPNQLQGSTSNQTDLSTQSPKRNSMDFIVGLPLSSGTSGEIPVEQKSILNTQKKVHQSNYNNLSSMKIKKINVNFYLEESIASPALDKTITTLVGGIIPMVSDCDDCISIETMQFQKSTEKSELDDLKEKIESMERDRRKEELAKLDEKFEDLQSALIRSEDQREMWEEQAILDREFQRRQDSLRLAKLESDEDAERLQLDTLLFKAQQKIDTVINARINSETETKKDLIEIIKYGQGNLTDENDQGILGMKGGKSSDTTIIYLGFAAILFLIILVLLFKKQKQDVVYLKPKGGAKKKSKKDKEEKIKNDSEEDSQSNQDVISSSEQAPPTINPYATMANDDENVIRAELKALRQSAVSMSVNQQEGATQIVKDWLSDGGDNEESTEGEEG